MTMSGVAGALGALAGCLLLGWGLSGCSAACIKPAEITGSNNGTHVKVRCTLAEGDCATGWRYSRGSGKLACSDGRILATVTLPEGVTPTVVP